VRATLPADDRSDEMGAAWGAKDQLRRLQASLSLVEAEHKMRFDTFVFAANAARHRPALGHHRRLVGRHRGARHHRSHPGPHEGREHPHQA
jgi:hypothetical protein